MELQVLNSEPDMPLSDSGKSGRIDIDTRLHFAALVNSSNDPILTKDLDGRILSWNCAAARVFGYEEDEILGESILRLTRPELHQAENELL